MVRIGVIASFLLVVLSCGHFCFAQDNGAFVNVTSWQQDDPPICAGCFYRTGQNLKEGALTTSISGYNFGQFCSYNVDGQIYGQPLVVTSVKFNGGAAQTVVYVATQNDSVYAFAGTPSAPSGSPPQCTLLQKVSLLGSGETPVLCQNVGGQNCATIAPVIGVIGTPAIRLTGVNPATGTLYAVAETQYVNGSTTTYYHRLYALDITTLSVSFESQPIAPAGLCSYPKPFSQFHIQRPALLYAGDKYLYVAFSMMDGGGSPLPNGMIFGYNTANLSAAPLCLQMSSGATLADGAGIWQDGAGPAFGPDSTGTDYTYFNTANGVYDGSSNWGDSFIKMYNNPNGGGSGIPALQVAGSYTPVDQLDRSSATCGTSGDIDFGSGGVALVPEIDITWPYLAVSGDKEGGMWFFDRSNPKGYNGDGSCSGTSGGGTGDDNVQTYPINGSGLSLSGPIIHNNPAYWKGGSTVESWLFMGSQHTGTNTGELLRYQLCTQGKPIHNSTSPACSTASAYAYAVSGTPLQFPYGVTPTISANGSSANDALLWAIWSDGSVVPANQQFSYNGTTFPVAQNGRLYAFDADSVSDNNMKKLYSSLDCKPGGSAADAINPATKFSVPAIANGYLYLGTQGPACYDANFPASGVNSCYNSGTFYIFGSFSSSRTCN